MRTLVMSGCNTMHWFGQDLGKTAEAIQKNQMNNESESSPVAME